jgi:hypothetical protein
MRKCGYAGLGTPNFWWSLLLYDKLFEEAIRNLNSCLRGPQMEFQTPMIYYREVAGTSS